MIKVINLKKLKRLIIWNRESSSQSGIPSQSEYWSFLIRSNCIGLQLELNEQSTHATWSILSLGRNQNDPLCDCFLFISTNICSGLPIQHMWLITDWCTARLTHTTGDQAECQPKSKHNCKTHLQSYDKLQATQLWALFAKKNGIYCRIHELHPT